MPNRIEPSQLEVDVANVLCLDLATTVRGSLVIHVDEHSVVRARWDGAMILTEEQVTAVRRIVEEADARDRRRAARSVEPTR